MPNLELAYATLAEVSDQIRRKRISPVEVTRGCLERIESLNPTLNAFITVLGEAALRQAHTLEDEAQRGRWRGPLHGIPIALKDLIDTAGVKTTAASGAFKDRIPAEDAEVVRRLKAAGAVIIGKANLDEFAFSFTSETSYFGPIHNPWKLTHTPGGSSGGSAAAVAAGLCYAALGSDTGGSIRQPAAFCGVAGLKPSYGLVSTRGALPLAWSLDHIGPLARTVRDAALVLQAIAGFDPVDPHSASVPIPDYARALRDVKMKGVRIGVARKFFLEQVHPEIAKATERALTQLAAMGCEIRDVELPDTSDMPVLIAEAYAWHEPLIAKHRALYHPRTLYWLEQGGEITMPQYAHGRQKMAQLRRNAARLFEQVDIVVTPATAQPPIPLQAGREPDLILLRNAIPMNLLDLPSISVPCGFTSDGLPIGIQFSGARLQDARVLAMAHAFEQQTRPDRPRVPPGG
jgi:aspartyl-tRNA(Asn)/glutamyl-tRNA(Gln) amidotransferase subunit A